MKTELQRIAIAEACGYKHVFAAKDDPDFFWALRYLGEPSPTPDERWAVPNYITDLNAMHEAEGILTPEQRGAFGCILHDILGVRAELNDDDQWGGHEVFICSHAKAAQRAEAFLRTLNLWTP